MRTSCMDCARKHIAQADILMMEHATGDYPAHKWYAIGHLSEACDELLGDYPDIAARVRKAKLEYMNNGTNVDLCELIELISSFDAPDFDRDSLNE